MTRAAVGRRALAAALAAALAGAAGGSGCGGGERVAECDALLVTIEKVAACNRIERGARLQLEQTVRSMREALDRLEAVGPDRAPADVVTEARRTCTRQEEEIRRAYEKVAPDCLR